MLKKKLLLEINDLLEKYQFRKLDATWNRESGDFIDVIDLQVAKSGDTFTINVGAAEKSVLIKCWGPDSLEFVAESACTIRARLGELACGRDVWWSLREESSIEEVLYGIDNSAIPFLRLSHSIDRMVEALESNPSARSYPPEAIYLALLYHRRGEGDRGLNMLRTLRTKFSGGWREKVSEILNGLELK